jgi:hypothetical protein
MKEENELITVFCEGPHDVAFVYRIFKSIGYETNDGCKIGNFPMPFNGLIQQEAEKSNVENLNLQEIRRGFLPSRTLKKGNKFIFLYSIGSDTKQVPRQEMLKKLFSFIPAEGEISVLPEGTKLAVIYLFDADDIGVTPRLDYVNNEINAIIETNESINFIENGTYQTANEIKFGTYIFTGEDNNTGALEDILIPLMAVDNEEIFENANSFLDTDSDDARLFPLKISVDNATNVITEVRSTRNRDKYKFDGKKSIVGVVGQLQCSGKANTVCISDSDYITLAKIQTDTKCIEIFNFLNTF